MALLLTRSDLIFGDSLAVIILKWSKTNQFQIKIQHITIPAIPESVLSPVFSLNKMLALRPGSENDPLFCICIHVRWLLFYRQHFKEELK